MIFWVAPASTSTASSEEPARPLRYWMEQTSRSTTATRWVLAGGVAAADPTAAAAVETGLEVSIPLANLGSPHGNIEVMAVITGGSNTYTSNQFLPGLPTVVDNVYNTTNPYNLNGTTNGFNLGSVANGFFTVVAPVASGINSVWLATGNGSWSTAGNWSAGIPNSAGDIANFNGSNTAAANVTLDGSHTVGQIVFNSLNTYNISQGTGGTLTINDTGDTAGVNPLITVNTGSHIISAPVSLFNGLTVNALNLTNLNVSGGVSGTGGITKIGGGNLALSGATTFTGGVTVLNGSVELDVNSAAAGNTITLGDPTADNVFTSLNIGQSGLNITLPVVTNYDDSESDNQRAIAAIYPTGSSTYSGTITVNGGIVLSAPVGTSLVMSGTIQNGTVVNGTKQKHDLTVNGQSGTNGGTVALTVPETYTGLTIVNGGTLSVTPQATLASTGYYVNTGGLLSFTAQNSGGIYTRTLAGPLTINGGTVAIAGSTLTANRQLLVATGLSFSGTTGAWTGQLDLANNDLDIPNGNLAQMTDQVKQGFNATGTLWTGQGITSSSAAGNTSQLTALGVIANTADGTNPLYGSGTAAGLFDGANPAATDVLVKYTYYGDANLDGKVDASDYSRIDSNFATGGTLTGWYNGDFNYDGVVNGSDYTLIDNAFNRQGAHLTAELAASTAEIAGGISGSSSVPEPTTLGLMTIAIAGLLGRRKRAN